MIRPTRVLVLIVLVHYVSSARGANISWDGGGSNDLWGTFANWNPNGDPTGDDITIDGNFTTLLNADIIVNSLRILNSGEVVNSHNGGASGEFELGVQGNTSIFSGSGITLYGAGGGGDGLDTDSLTIFGGGSLTLNSQEPVGTAVAEVDNGNLFNEGTIRGNGVIQLNDSAVFPLSRLNNNGALSATHICSGFCPSIPPATLLRIVASDTETRVDLDGTNTPSTGEVNVGRNATLNIDVPLSDRFDGTINLSSGGTLDIANAWEFAGTLNVVSAPLGGGPAAIAGELMTMQGGTIVLDDPALGPPDQLRFTGLFIANAGTISNHGTIIVDPTGPVLNSAVLSGANFRMLGDFASLTVSPDARFTIQDADFELDAAGQPTNVTTVGNSGSLVLNLDFNLADETFHHTINLSGGELQVNNSNAAADPEWDIGSTGVVNVQAAASPSSLDGNPLQVLGSLALGANARLNIDTDGARFSSDATVTMAPGSELSGTSLITINNSTGIVGAGRISARVINNTQIEANGGTLIVATPGNDNDWDGAAQTGELRASNGTLEIRDNAAVSFDGEVRATNGTIFVNGFDLTLLTNSHLSLIQSTFRSTDDVVMDGTMFVSVGAASRTNVAGQMTFPAGSSSTLNGELVLDNTLTVIRSGAVFTGNSPLVNEVARTLRLRDTASVGVLVENRGTLEIGLSPGRADVLEYQQDPTGHLHIELAGTGLNDFDRLVVAGQAQLSGTLDVSLLSGFMPVQGNIFRFLTATAGITGIFSTGNLPSLPAGLFWDVNYGPTFVELAVTNSGLQCDLNSDGSADAADAGIMFGNWGNPGAGDCSGDGIVDAADAGLLFGEWTGDSQPASVPEPSASMILLLSLAGLSITNNRKCRQSDVSQRASTRANAGTSRISASGAGPR